MGNMGNIVYYAVYQNLYHYMIKMVGKVDFFAHLQFYRE
jgi:hypothetical protein